MVGSPSGVRNATALMVLEGAFHIYLGYWVLQFIGMLPMMFQFYVIIGSVMIVLGLLVFAVSLAVWLQKSWATRAIIGTGVASCASLVIFGYYMITIFIILISYASIDYLRLLHEQSDELGGQEGYNS
ncbi:MAG: hypothetical protein ACFFE2_07480 [Candidatus Thorarchaeota archaeon]